MPTKKFSVALGLLLAGCARHDRGGVDSRIQQLKHQEASVRHASAMALGELGPGAVAAIPALSEALHDSDTEVRCQAAHALGQIGQDARSAIPALIEGLNDQNEQFRESAMQALKEIAPEAAHAGQ